MLILLHMFEVGFCKMSNIWNLGIVLDLAGGCGCVASSQSCCGFSIWRRKLHTYALHPDPGSPGAGFCVLKCYQQQWPQTFSRMGRMKGANLWSFPLSVVILLPPTLTKEWGSRGTMSQPSAWGVHLAPGRLLLSTLSSQKCSPPQNFLTYFPCSREKGSSSSLDTH